MVKDKLIDFIDELVEAKGDSEATVNFDDMDINKTVEYGKNNKINIDK